MSSPRNFAKGYVTVTFDTHGFKTYIAQTIPILRRAPEVVKLAILTDYGDAEREYLDSMNQCQIRMNKALGFNPSEIPVLTPKDVENEAEYTPRTYMKELGYL